MTPRNRVFVLASILACVAAPANAQSRRLSIDATLGLAAHIGTSTEYQGKDLFAGSWDIVVASAVSSPTILAGISASGTGRGGADACETNPELGCYPKLPTFKMYMGHVGLQTPSGAVRILTGAGVARGGDETVLAMQGRVDAAASVWRGLSVVGSLRSILVPDYDGGRFLWVYPGLGLRLNLSM